MLVLLYPAKVRTALRQTGRREFFLVPICFAAKTIKVFSFLFVVVALY